MKYLNKYRFFSVLVTLFLFGCATVTPIRDFVSTGNPSASKISISSINATSIFNRNAVLPGKIYINSIFYGEFSDNQREFSAEVLAGTNLVVICPQHQQQCINAQINVLPNKHYKYRYTLAQEYRVLWLNYIWKLIPIGVEDYFPNSNITTPTRVNNKALPVDSNTQIRNLSNSPQIQPVDKTATDVESKMEAGKARCSALGFQVGTQSFGECILRLSQ